MAQILKKTIIFFMILTIFSINFSFSKAENINSNIILDIGLNGGKKNTEISFSSLGLILKSSNDIKISNEEQFSAKLLDKIKVSNNPVSRNRLDFQKSYYTNNGIDFYEIVTDNSGIEKNSLIGIYSKGRLVFAFDDNKDFSFVGSREYFELGNKKYRGSLKFLKKSSLLVAVNRIGIEEYLYGVVPIEMTPTWEMEALKAQAVSARSFAISNINKFSSSGYNLTDDTRSQAYVGYAGEYEKSNLAVDETKGEVGYFDGKIAELIYHSSSGGATVSAEEIWGGVTPYLIGRNDPYSIGTPYDNWKYEITAYEIEKKLSNLGKSIGSLKEIRIDKVSDYGYITQITFVGSYNNQTFKGDSIRFFFGSSGLKSLKFVIGDSVMYTVTGNKVSNESFNDLTEFLKGKYPSTYAAPVVREENKTMIKVAEKKSYPNKGKYIFSGSGFGHGVGMSQYGAKNMAEEGKNYRNILEYYYKDIEIKKI